MSAVMTPDACTLCGAQDHYRGACPWADQLQPAQRYEAEKHAWALAKPGASSEAYEAAVQEIARRVGL